jgi:lysophospholipase L1-like esterase
VISLKRWLLRLAVLVVSLAVSALVLEAAVRVVAPQQLVQLRPDVWVPRGSGLGHGLAPNLDTLVNTGEREVRLRTDEHGYRVGDPPAQPPDLRVLALGDSFLEALAVPEAETMTARLGRTLSESLSARVEVVNTGVSGSSPNRYRIANRLELARRPYAAVVVFLFLGNDVVGRRVEDRPPRAPTPQHPLRWPADLSYRAFVDAVVHPLYTRLREHSHLLVLLKERWLGAAIRLGLTDHVFPSVLLRAQADAGGFEVTTGLCEEIARDARDAGAPSLFVLLPPDYVVDREMGRAFARGSGVSPEDVDLDQAARILAARLRGAGLRVVDATPGLRAAGPGVYGSVDRHLSPRGHEVVARIVAPELAPLLAGAAR